MQGPGRRSKWSTAGGCAVATLVFVTFSVGVSTYGTGTPPRSTKATLNQEQASKQQQQQPESSIEATGSWSKGVAESKEEGWWPGESEDNAAESSAYEEANNVALTGVGDVGFTASPPTETNENENENEDKIRNEIKSKHEKRQVEPKPNVFFILIDDMGWNDIGYQSSDMQAVTPNLNRMANSGIKLPQYYSQALCTPARGALMTGRYPIRYGFQYGLIAPGAAWGLPLDEKLLPEYLSDHGYTCHMAGKWHLGGQTFDHMPHRRGFETSLSYTFGAETYWTHQLVPLNESISEMAEHFVDIGFGNSTGYHHVTGRTPSPMGPHGGEGDRLGDGPVGINAAPAMRSASSTFSFSAGSPSLAPSVASPVSSAESQERYSTEMFTTRTLEILEDKTPFDEKPLFMYLAHQAVHSPLGPPPLDAFTDEEISVLDALGEEESSVRLSFAKVLMYLDKSIGQLMDYLEDEGWMDNSLVIVASDNGGCPSRGGSNTPFRGAKSTNWEGGTKVPAFVYSRSHIPEELWGTEYDGLVHVTDWLPTLAAAAGIELSGSRGDLDGVNHWEHIVGSSPSSPGNGEDGDGGVYGDFNVKLGDPDTTGGKSVSRSRSSNNAKTRIVGPRNEMLYNYDPYYLGAAADRTPSDPDYAQAQGAFRQGKWKFLFNECCLGHGTVQSDTTMFEKNGHELYRTYHDQEDAANDGGPYCYGCLRTCVAKADCKDWLYDLDEDPTEEHNLAHMYPEVVQDLRERVSSVVDREYSESLYVGGDPKAFLAWKNDHNYWVVPWLEAGFKSGSQLHQLEEASVEKRRV